MHKRNLMVVTLLLTVAITPLGKQYSLAGLPDLFTQHSKVETRSTQQALPWGELWEKQPPRDDPPGGSRGDVCPIAPAVPVEVRVIWSTRPLFLWRGSMGRLEVRLQGSQQALWSEQVTEGQSSVLYNGDALQPGLSYDWVSFDERDRPQFRVTFQVMAGEERDRISGDLNRLQAQLQQEGATAEKIAYAKANYLAENQLWSDVLQQAYGVENPSEALVQFIQAIPDELCPLSGARRNKR